LKDFHLRKSLLKSAGMAFSMDIIRARLVQVEGLLTMIRAMFVLIALTSYSIFANSSEPSVILGILENVPAHSAGQPDLRGVRIVFQKNGGDWQAFPSDCPDEGCLEKIASGYPQQVTWTIAFDGRNLGQVTGRTPKAFEFYSDVGRQEVTSQGRIPTIGKKSAEYAGFADSPVYRPLIANSQPYFKDPETWKPNHLSPKLITVLRQQFRKKFPKVSNCTNLKPETERAWLYHDEDIKLLKAYSSKNNWTIAQIRLEKYRCDGPVDDAFIDQWFVIDPVKQISFLGQDMWLVDAGDYDNDGKSELVFSIDGYNRGGYELFYDDFKKSAVFEFSYH
jgi:hypothetical protein